MILYYIKVSRSTWWNDSPFQSRKAESRYSVGTLISNNDDDPPPHCPVLLPLPGSAALGSRVCGVLVVYLVVLLSTPHPNAQAKELPTYKDNDFINDGQKIHIDDENKKMFMEKLRKDVEVGAPRGMCWA